MSKIDLKLNINTINLAFRVIKSILNIALSRGYIDASHKKKEKNKMELITPEPIKKSLTVNEKWELEYQENDNPPVIVKPSCLSFHVRETLADPFKFLEMVTLELAALDRFLGLVALDPVQDLFPPARARYLLAILSFALCLPNWLAVWPR
jgi:hypothetical protein